MAKIALGSFREAAQRDCHRALMAEFISTFFFVFTGVGSAMSADKMQLGNTLVGLFAVAIAHALVLAVTIATGLHSGVHLDPAVTIGLALGGEISIFRSILHWIDQLLASSLACFLLKYLTGGMVTPVFALGDGVGPLQGVIWEIILTFSLVFTVYATIVDPKRGSLDGLGPMLTGFVVGANALAAGPFSGGCMNPARAFGPALVSGNWTDHWVYWVGPLIGGSLGGLLYEDFIITKSYVPLSNKEDYI